MSKEGDTFTDNFDGLRILTVGRIADQKGYDLAIPALKRIIDDGYKVKWYVIGASDDDYGDYIKNLVKENNLEDSFIFLGTTPNPYRYLANSDIYAQPSRYEGKPIAIEEAKIMKKPILAANYLSASEQLEGGLIGEICEISTEGIYSALKKLLDSPEIRDGFIKELSKRDFSNRNEILKFYEIIG